MSDLVQKNEVVACEETRKCIAEVRAVIDKYDGVKVGIISLAGLDGVAGTACFGPEIVIVELANQIALQNIEKVLANKNG